MRYKKAGRVLRTAMSLFLAFTMVLGQVPSYALAEAVAEATEQLTTADETPQDQSEEVEAPT